VSRTLFIVGLGLVGGSLAASLKARNADWRVRATDRRQSAVDYGLREGLLDEGADDLRAGAAGADLVVLAAPVQVIRQSLGELAPVLRPGQVVTDVGSTKVSILAEARRVLPVGASFVGGHPIAGTERSGVESAVAGLFEGRPCVLTPAPDTDPSALERVSGLWQAVGAQVKFLPPDLHDRIFALVSHLPHALAYGLLQTVTETLAPEHAELVGGSLRDFIRVTAGSAAMWREIFLENREALLFALDAFQDRLRALRGAVEAGDADELGQFFRSAEEKGGSVWRR